MKKYVVIYHAPQDFLEQSASNDQAEMEKGMEDWMVWAKKCGDKLVDLGLPLMGGKRLLPDGGIDDSSRQVCGYSVLQAENMEEAQELLKGHPHLAWNGACEIEVHESMPLPGS